MNRSFFSNRKGIKRWQRKYLSYRSILKVCMQFWKIINWLYDFFAGWYYRRQFLRQRKAAITIQKCWRSYRAKKSYLLIRRGYLRLQAMLRSRVLAHRYRHIRSVIVRFQARCRGFYVRRYLFCPKCYLKQHAFLYHCYMFLIKISAKGEVGYSLHSAQGERDDQKEAR